MIISENSPFRKIPVNMHKETALLLDGMRMSIDMADMNYERLKKTLLSITINAENSKTQPNMLVPTAFSEVWSIIDATDKFRTLLNFHLKKCEKILPVKPKPLKEISNVFEEEDIKLYEFLEHTKHVRELRNCSQHLKDRLEHLISKQKPIMGILYWLDSRTVKDSQAISMYSVFSGSIINKPSVKINYPRSSIVEYPIGSIVLTAHGHSCNISELMKFIELAVKNLDEQYSSQITNNPVAEQDVVVRISWGNNQEELKEEN